METNETNTVASELQAPQGGVKSVESGAGTGLGASEDGGWLNEMKAAWNSWRKGGQQVPKSEDSRGLSDVYSPSANALKDKTLGSGASAGERERQASGKSVDANPLSRAEYDALQKQVRELEAQLKEQAKADTARATAELESATKKLINSAKESGAIGSDDTEAEKWLARLANADLAVAKETVKRLGKQSTVAGKKIEMGEDALKKMKQISRENVVW